MKVFVTGATGYLGLPITTTLRRAGHQVWGLTRSESKAGVLARFEIHPVVGDLGRPDRYADIASQCAVLIHAALESSAEAVAKDKAAVEALLAAARRGGGPKTLIFTSGTWVCGDTAEREVDETSPLAPSDLVAWRAAHEQLIVNASGVKGIVLRIGIVYGRQGWLTSAWFADAAAGKSPRVIGDGQSRWATVHVDDVADAYVRAAESGLGGEIFHVTDGSTPTVLELATAAARAAGYAGEITCVPLGQARASMGGFADLLATSQRVSSAKARRLLGWQPRFSGFSDEADVYFASWKASQP